MKCESNTGYCQKLGIHQADYRVFLSCGCEVPICVDALLLMAPMMVTTEYVCMVCGTMGVVMFRGTAVE